MEVLVPALVAALLAGVGDKPAWLAARLSERHFAIILLLIVAAHGVAAGIAAVLGTLIAPMLSPNARALLIALALVFAGGGALARAIRVPVRKNDGMATGVAGFISLVTIALFDATAFLTFGFAVRGPSPWLAALGATIGAGVLAFVAGTLGEKEWQALPLRAIDAVGGSILTVAGLVIGLGALRLI